MDEQTTFEPKAVLAPRRTRWNRLTIVVPVLALAAIASAGLSARSGPDGSSATDAAPIAAQSSGAAPPAATPPLNPRYPEQVLGIHVERLVDVEARPIARDTVVAIAGWYVATSIDDCPPLAAIYRLGSLPEIRGGDPLAYCHRHGVFYASRPGVEERLPTNNLEDNRLKDAGLPAVAATLVIGVLVPPELEIIGAEATPVVVLAHFTPTGGCRGPRCVRELVIDHLAWADGF
jgi:hypothetical protein